MDYKDAYHALRSQHSDLQRKYHDRAEELKRTNVQLSKIENLMRAKERLEGGPPTTLAMREENEAIIKGLYQDKARLERRNGELDRKCRALVDSLEKKKREVAVLKRAARTGPRRLDRPTTAPEHVDLGASRVSFSSSGETTGRRKNVDALVEKFKRRVEEAEDQLQRVKEDNKELRSKLQRQGRPLVVNSVKEVRSPMADKNRGFADDNAELREAKAEAQLLEMRYKQLEENTRAQRDVQKAQFDQLDEYNRRIRDLRRALQDSEADKDKLRLDADRVDELQERVTELQTANRRLEDELLNLSDVALNQDFSGRDGEKERVAQLERNDARARAEFDNLRKSAEGTQEAFVALQQQVDDLRAQKNRAEHELQQLKLRSSTEQVQSTVTEDKAKLFGGLDGVDMEELERALTIVKKREHMKNPDDFDFLEKIDPEIGNDLRQADFKQKLEELRERHLQTQYELERAEKMLKVQMSINRDLHLELEDASSKKSVKHAELLQKVEDYEALNVKRLQRIHTLEAQLKQARYSTGKKSMRTIDEDDRSETTESTNLLLAELQDGDLAADENLVEVWVVSASLDEGVVSPNASTFAVVDFLTYESQATQWLPGSKPEFDFATSYKVSVDDLFLRYLATESLSLEICEAQQADYELLAKASIPLAPLLDSKPTLILDKQPLIAARTGRKAGEIHVEIRLALPVTELYQMFLDRHPSERANIEKAMMETLNAPGLIGESDDSARLENEIEVVVHSAVDLPTREGRSKPSPYVHYQFLQFQDAFTPVTRSSCDPTFEHVLSYPMATTTQACALLRTERLTFTVLDFQEENASIGDADDALIGTCEVPLSLLSDGESVFSTATLLSDTGREVGTLRVCVRWKHAFKQARTPDGSALDEKEVNWCLERFSPRKDGQVDYLSFLHAVDAPPRVDAARQELVAFVEKRRLETGASGRDILESIDVEALSEDEFADALKAMGCQSSADELCAFLRHARKAHSGRFGLEELLQECRRAPPAEASVRLKMKAQAERLRRLGRELAGPFEDLDPARSGRLPRPHFRQGLRGLGFDLVDEPSQQVEDMFEDKRKHDVAQLLGAEFVSDAESEDDLIDRHTKARLAAFEEDVDQQKQFEAKMRRMEEDNQRALSAPAPAPVFVEQDPIRGLRAEAPVPSSPPAHRASVEAVSPIRQDYDDLNVSVAAALPKEDSRVVETSSLLDAERALLSALAKKSTDLGKAFRKVDSSSSGVLARKEFAYALGKKIQLTSADVGALMDHFSTSSGVDYKAFLRFAEDQKVPLSAAAKALDRIAVHAGTLQRLQSADSSMTGSLPADTFGTVLRSLGHDLDGNELRSVTQLFPPRRVPKGVEQHVDYEAFYEACLDRKASTSLKDVDGRLRKAVLDILAKGGPEQLREEFRRADRQGRSSLDRTDAEALLDTLLGSPACSRDEARAVLARLDSVGDGVTYDQVIKFAKEEEVVKPYAAETQDWAHLKVRVKACLVESYDRLGNERGDAAIKSCFKRYDWKGADVLSSELFAQSCRNAGILLGASDLRGLAERFETGSNTAYSRFLTWALEADAPSSRKEEKHARRAKEALERISPVLREARRWGVRAFERYDRDERGVVDRRDFERILEDFNCDLEGKELKALCHQYSNDDGIDYKLFVKAVEGDKVESVLVVTADAADVLRDALKVKVREGIDYRAAFEREDGSYSGTLDRKALERVLRQLDINLEGKQLDDLERKFRAATSGGIHYIELLNAVLPTRPTVGDNWRVEEKLRAMIKRRFEWWQPGALRRAYKHFDTKRKNKLLPADLADGLRALKVKLSAQQEQDLFDGMDLDKDGTISYTEFIVFVRDPCHPFLEQKVRYATHRAKLRPSDAEDALRDVDDNRSGLVGLRDFGVVLERLGVELTSSERKRLAQRFDSDESGNVSSSAFLAFLKGDVESGESGHPALASLKRELRNSKKDIGRCFREFDDEDRGVLGLRDFRRFLEALGVELDASDVKACAEALGDDGLVSLKKFRTFAEDESSGDNDDTVRKAAKKLKLSQRDVKKAFLRYDEDDSGEVSARNFERVLDKLGFELDKDVIEAFDGKYLKFVKCIADEDDDDEDDVDGVLKKLRKESRALRRSLEGDISERKLRNAADDAGVRLSTADLKQLTKSFEGRRDDIDGDKLQRALSKDDDSDDDDRVLKKLSKEVKRLNRKDPDYERVLRDFERDDGELSKKDFRKALDRIGMEFDDDEVDELAEKFGRRGVVKSRKFLEAVEKDRESDDDDKVTRACKGKEKKLKRAFEKADDDEEGRVSRKKFSRVLEDVGVDLTSRDLESVMDKFEKRDKVDYGKFLKSIAADDDDDDDVFGAIKSALKEAKDEGESPLKVFEKLDRDAAGELDADDVKRALKKLGYTPTAFELKKCKERFPGKKEDVNYEDLVSELLGSKKKRRASSDSDDESERGRSPSKSRSALKKLKKELAKLEDKKGRRLKFDKYFEAYDSEGKDYVSERDFRKALQKLGVELDDDKKAFEACASKFDKRGDGRIRWRDFVSWARDDSSSDERNPSRTRERRSRSRSRGRR